ncbi:DUF4334 domain-containing protein [Ketobacter sp. MCCC 1A13808]|uniref:DUF4334 domain-containing protein n=1 Tax=Ketobacter sp. MCCC 1A13808 TaxID=2602738 RepID=UPI000F2847D7|nr:DUF4334 domain-containing protein [Ketobacter sp. MCCC 1A13808]MVF11537.1 DUF4334 domain-containing protein [Ketobacter sp. MCCC 1A13808]RLP53262.1 MAG: DUF4334 domain-containing protein [Ketobacter sp.]
MNRAFTLLTVFLFATLFSINSQATYKHHSNKKLQQKWQEIIDSGGAYTTEELMPLFLKLRSIDPEAIMGQWRGGKFDGGLPDPINWYGKRFVNMEYVEPLLVTAPDGSIQAYTGLGTARLREVLFENRVSTSLIYDNQPIIDYFRKVTDDLIIGFGEVKGEENEDFFFYLIRE